MRLLEGAKPDPEAKGARGRSDRTRLRFSFQGASDGSHGAPGSGDRGQRTVRQRPRALPGSAVEAPNLSPCRAWRATRPLGACGVQERVLDPRGGEPSCREDEFAVAVDVVVLALAEVGAGASEHAGDRGGRGADGDDAVETPSRASTGVAKAELPTRTAPDEAGHASLRRARLAAADRNDRGSSAVRKEAVLRDVVPVIPAPVLAETWAAQARPAWPKPVGSRSQTKRWLSSGGRRAVPAGQGHRCDDATVAASASRWGDFG